MVGSLPRVGVLVGLESALVIDGFGSVELTLQSHGPAAAVSPAGVADFTLVVATLRACPSFELVESFALELCGGVAGGVLVVVGDGFNDIERSLLRPWVHLAGGARVRAVLLEPVSIALGVHAAVPLIVDSFRYDDVAGGMDLHRASPITGALTVALAATLR